MQPAYNVASPNIVLENIQLPAQNNDPAIILTAANIEEQETLPGPCSRESPWSTARGSEQYHAQHRQGDATRPISKREIKRKALRISWSLGLSQPCNRTDPFRDRQTHMLHVISTPYTPREVCRSSGATVIEILTLSSIISISIDR